MTAGVLTLAEATRIVREATKDKSYQQLPLGADVAAYLIHKRRRLTEASMRAAESSLDKLVRHFADLELPDFEPPIGTTRLEEYLNAHWGDAAPGTYNVNLSWTRDFFKWAQARGLIHGNPALAIDRAKKRQVHREIFSDDDRRRIVAAQDEIRDRLALRLLFDYALRKGALRNVQFRHFDHVRKRLTVFTKGAKVLEVPIPDPAFWHDLERHILDVAAASNDFLLCKRKVIPRAGVRYWPKQQMSSTAAHRWWYGCLERAGIVPEGVTSGERMHKARHTAGQRVLDHTKGNIVAVKELLGHESIKTTADVYLNWSLDQLNDTLAGILAAEDDANRSDRDR